MNQTEYKFYMAENKDFWELEGLDNIIKYLTEHKLSYIIYRLGETLAASVAQRDEALVAIELKFDSERVRVMRYFATYQLFTIHAETNKL